MSSDLLRKYKSIHRFSFTKGDYTLSPVRDEDKYAILKWRNDQIEILRQQALLTEAQQEHYFKTVIDQLFEETEPAQLIFSFFERGLLIAYGGLVHIDWKKGTAEISFLTETSRSKNEETFINDWTNYLSLIKQVASDELNFSSIFTYAYDLRPNLYIALERSGFRETKRIKDHITINGELKDVVIHTFFMDRLEMTIATEKEVDLYFRWANDPEVRKFSFQQDPIRYEDHVKWYASKIHHPAFRFYLFLNTKHEPVGQVRINENGEETIIGISIDAAHRGLGYGSRMLRMGCGDYFKGKKVKQITAYIKMENRSSTAIFKRAGFVEKENLLANQDKTLKLILRNEEF